MEILKNLKTKVSQALRKCLFLNEQLYVGSNGSIVCKDKVGDRNLSTTIVATHVDLDADIPVEFPTFGVVKSSSVEGGYGTHKKYAFTFDTDDEPIMGSKNLLTSGTIYEVVKDLQSQIDDLKKQIK